MIQILKQLKRVASVLLKQVKFLFALQSRSAVSPRIFYMMGVSKRFPNLGDQAQAGAIPRWLHQHFAWPVIHIKNDEVHACLPLLKRFIKPNDVVFLHSGGNFGDDWYATQLDREWIIASLQQNCIVQLPQTVFYSNTASGQAALAQSQAVISSHPHLLMFGRDAQSAALSQQWFPSTQIHARPDMVLSLHNHLQHTDMLRNSAHPIKKVLCILRNDKEGIYQAHDKQALMQHLSATDYEVALWDTDVDDTFTEEGRLATLVKYLTYIASFDAVVTDRYHGLIFSVLIKRPCVVMKTHNHKLTSAFDWFDQVNFTRRADSHAQITQALAELGQLSTYQSPDWNKLHFDPMAHEAKAFLAAYHKSDLKKAAYA